MRAKKAAVGAATLVVAGWYAVAGVAAADPTPADPTPAPPAPAATPAPPAPGAQPKTSIDADGIYKVGTDIAPGTYASAGPVGDGACYWKRAGADGGATLDNAMTKQAQVVQIDPTDGAFKTNGCQPWQLADPGTAAPTGLGPMLGKLQLGAALARINAGAGAYDGSQVPGP